MGKKTLNRTKLALAGTAIAGAAVFAALLLAPRRHNPVSRADVVGTWLGETNPKSRVIIGDDGSLELVNIPQKIFYGDLIPPPGNALSQKCKWQFVDVSKDYGHDAEIEIDTAKGWDSSLEVTKDDEGMHIYFIIGDPDQHEMYAFRKLR